MSVNSTFLRRALALDAAASGATRVLMLAAAGPLGELLGLPVPLLRGAGLVLLPYVAYVAFVALLACRSQIASTAVWAVIACNAIWTAASFAILAEGLVAPNALGTAFVVGQAVVVAALGILQYAALRRPLLKTA